MSKCTRAVDTAVLECKAWATEAQQSCRIWGDQGQLKCSQWADEGSSECSQWADEGSNECSQWADEGSNECSQWADEGSNECSDWGKKCHWYTPWNCVAEWFCKAYYWVSKWVCKGWYWVAKWLCKAWYWVAKWVCKAWYWVAKWVCKGWYWVAKWVCLIWFWILKTVCVVWGWAASFVCWIVGLLKCWINGLLNLVLNRTKRLASGAKIEKIFVLMLENRSYDHMLGFSRLSGPDAVTGGTTNAEGVLSGSHSNIDPDTSAAVSVSTPADFKISAADGDPPHEFEGTLKQLCGAGKSYPDAGTGGYPPINNTGYIQAYKDSGSAHAANIMRCYDPKQLPILNRLASEFAVCDHWFSSMPGPTWPNRFFVHAASANGLDNSPDGKDIVSAEFLDGYKFKNGNIFDRLDDNCIDWEIFEGDEFPQTFALSGMNLNALEGKFTDFEDFASEVKEKDYGPSYVFIEPHYGNVLPTTPEDYTCGTSQHPLDDITRGDRLIKQVYEAIRNSPHWEKSLLIVTWDEHGGFYDHLAPPATVAPGDGNAPSLNKHGFDFTQLGVRVPAVVVSPLIPKGTIDHTIFDHSSVLATIERTFGLKHLTKRDQAAADVLHLLSLSTPRTDAPATLPNAANSGFSCENDEDLGIASSALSGGDGNANNGEEKPEVIGKDRPVPSSFWGWAHVAMRRSLTVLKPEQRAERKKLLADYEAIKTEADARLFLNEARLRVNAARRPDKPWKASRLHRTNTKDKEQ